MNPRRKTLSFYTPDLTLTEPVPRSFSSTIFQPPCSDLPWLQLPPSYVSPWGPLDIHSFTWIQSIYRRLLHFLPHLHWVSPLAPPLCIWSHSGHPRSLHHHKIINAFPIDLIHSFRTDGGPIIDAGVDNLENLLGACSLNRLVLVYPETLYKADPLTRRSQNLSSLQLCHSSPVSWLGYHSVSRPSHLCYPLYVKGLLLGTYQCSYDGQYWIALERAQRAPLTDIPQGFHCQRTFKGHALNHFDLCRLSQGWCSIPAYQIDWQVVDSLLIRYYQSSLQS